MQKLVPVDAPAIHILHVVTHIDLANHPILGATANGEGLYPQSLVAVSPAMRCICLGETIRTSTL